ncbi:HpcH/HpaI aldolase/citrate lyase family protein [Aspergillus heteromorphus CBS 117.55]|uniref:HpcH/HpaI aldolase/citrate lyase family protein n=1 Tax=Aspergillus heteromorphus CBS 117.55 TaxID=1448321 RepID=A0A317VGR0_9EURO|nr:HpcH/HpaI aldolase/citrate lyase family protein [Aspergillus heteromorphus CBS 117.55]PWY71030.1 HpcH/HpaI aldolase/citrate lyase family protein [Aspergillus heteromorphus CBS 117.55]
MASFTGLSNPLRAVFTEGERPSLGVWQMFPGANISRALAKTPDIDWVLVDCEHGNIDDGAMHDAVPAIAALGVSPIVRVADNQSWMIKRALDCGAHGILIPLLRTAQDARDAVNASKFPPWGNRGFGSPFAMERFNPVPSMTEYLQHANASLLTMVQIETKEALAEVEDIAEVPGIDVLFIGPFDLGNNIGHPVINGEIKPELNAAIVRIRDAARAAGKKSGIFCTSGAQAKHFADMGFDMLSISTDVSGLSHAMTEAVSLARGEGKVEKKASY